MKLRTFYICQQCGFEAPQWNGKCPNCDTWNSLVETVKEVKSESANRRIKVINESQKSKPVKLSEVKHIEKNRLKSGFNEFDRVMGGGIVPGSVTLLAGDPGIGKSTLLLLILDKIGGLYISGEESAEQIKLRAQRLGVKGGNIEILAETDIGVISENISTRVFTGNMEKVKPANVQAKPLVIIDSIQTLFSQDLSGMPGSVGQVRYCAEILVRSAKELGLPVMMIGHVTKEGTIAGPRILEHMVDVVLYLEGERSLDARILRTFKNRFGAIEEVGIFEMQERGLKEIENPSAVFLQDRVQNVSGSVVTVLIEGTRPILAEIQALVVPSQLAVPRRVSNGIDFNRLQLISAILTKRLNLPLGGFDIYVNVSGGLHINEPATDLAVALAILSSFKNKPLKSKTAVFGELGLLGEVRSVSQEDIRVKEARRSGYTDLLYKKSVKNLTQAQNLMG